MTVRELIAHLQTFEPNLPVAYSIHSEHSLLERDDIDTAVLKMPRFDGWIHDTWHGEQDAKTQTYVVFP